MPSVGANLARAAVRRRLELQLERDPVRRDPELREARDERAQAARIVRPRLFGAELVEPVRVRRREVDLPDQDRRLRGLAPPVGRLAADVRRVRDRDPGPRAELLQLLEQQQRVRAVLRVEADHGVGVCAPKSSFIARIGCSQPVTVTAKSYRPFARAGSSRVGRGVVVPIRLLKLRSKRTVAAPFARICDGTSVPDDIARIIPGSTGSGAS